MIGLLFTLPFIGLILGWFFVGVFLTAPMSRALMGTSGTYAISLIAVLLIGIVVATIMVAFEARLKAATEAVALKFAASFLAILVGFAVGFAPPFLMLLLHAPAGT